MAERSDELGDTDVLDDTDVLGVVEDLADTNPEADSAQAGERDNLADTDVLAGAPASEQRERIAERADSPNSQRGFDDVEFDVGQPNDDEPTLSVGPSEPLAAEADEGWESVEELRRALSQPLGDADQTDEQTIEVESVYSRSRLGSAAQGVGDEPDEVLDPFELTGLQLLDDSADATSESAFDEAPETERFEERPHTKGSDPPAPRRDWSRELTLGLDAIDEQLRLQRPWAQFTEELRQETVSEPDAALRSSYLFLLANLLRLHGGVGGEAGARLERAAAGVGEPIRSVWLDAMVTSWDEAGEAFVDALEKLEARDARAEPETAGVRRASVAATRLLDGGLPEPSESALEDRLYPPETLPGLALRGIRAHQQRHRSQAAQIWRQVARHLRGEPREVVLDASAYWLRGTPGFFEFIRQRLGAENSSRPLLAMMQREAAAVGDHLREAVALRHLVAGDVALGRQLSPTQTAQRERLKHLASARFFRLATLLRGLGRARKSDAALTKLDHHRVMRDAVALSPRRPLYLRRLARWSRARGDLNTCAKSLGSLAMAYQNRRLSALASAELARTIHIGGGKSELVHQYLVQALEVDPGCAPARLAYAHELIRRGHSGALQKLQRSGGADAIDVDFSPGELQLIEEGQYEELARLLERRLDSAVESHEWAALTYRLAHLHGWELSPAADSRLRAEFLEQVLIADPDHLAALVALCDVRLARREFREACDALEGLSQHIEEPTDRASLLVEQAGVVEHNLGAPDVAFELFEQALRLEPDNADAFFGVLRTDSAASDGGVHAIVDRLQAGVAVREGDELAMELVLRVDQSPAARAALEERFPDRPLGQFLRLCLCCEEGRDGAEALHQLRRIWGQGAVEPLFGAFERFFGAQRPTERTELYRRLNLIQTSPMSEGRLVSAMYDARKLGDAEILGMLAAIRSRRSAEALVRATEMAWMAVTLLWRGEDEQALKVSEHLLERFPEYLPAMKLAKLLSERLGQWGEQVRWCEREAERTRVPQVAFENRVLASEVQRKYLGDFDAALQQFRTVLAKDPSHEEAFEKLKPLLLQRGELDHLFELYERRLSHTPDDRARAELLEEMADIALHRGKDRRAAITYFRRSLDLEPGQLRSLRILGELLHEAGETDQALECYRRAANLADIDVLVERLWEQVGELLAEQDRDLEALEAYELALRANPSRTDIILKVAQLEANLGDRETALIHLQRVESTASNPETLREARALRARFLTELGRPEKQVLSAYRDLLLNHPDDTASVDRVCDYLAERGRRGAVPEFFDELTYRALQDMQGRQFKPHFAIARHLGHVDRAFRLAAVGKELDYNSRQMEQLYMRHAARRRWPSAAMPREALEAALPGELQGAFLQLLRHSESMIRAATGQIGFAANARPIPEPSNQAMSLAFRWPALYGLELAEVREVERLEGGSAVLVDGAVTLVIDHRWRETSDPTQLLVHLGRKLGAYALGVGAWSSLAPRVRLIAVCKLVGHLAPGWGGQVAERSAEHLDWSMVAAMLEGAEHTELSSYALELSGRLSPQAVEPQFRLVELALERAACMVLDDPSRYLPHTEHLGAEHGLLAQPWSFLFSPVVGEVRRRLGIAVSPPSS